MAKEMGKDYSKYSAENEIKKMGEIDTLNMTDLAQANPYMLERLSKIKEFYMKQTRATLARKSLGITEGRSSFDL